MQALERARAKQRNPLASVTQRGNAVLGNVAGTPQQVCVSASSGVAAQQRNGLRKPPNAYRDFAGCALLD
ncbi:MAG: hypothetical protein E6G96_14775 [Alphaproteobacteria bacterium]|nr:MAG: hypothetical protein E6G96_14775 [Alphaproteobacteria bacterium]